MCSPRVPTESVTEGPAAKEHRALYFVLWDWDGTLDRIHHALYVAALKQDGRDASPSAAIIDCQSGKAAQKGVCARTFT
jgi:hypothetical protein